MHMVSRWNLKMWGLEIKKQSSDPVSYPDGWKLICYCDYEKMQDHVCVARFSTCVNDPKISTTFWQLMAESDPEKPLFMCWCELMNHFCGLSEDRLLVVCFL